MKIKVEGYINSEDFEDPDFFDANHQSGLTEAGFDHFANGPLEFLESVRFTRS